MSEKDEEIKEYKGNITKCSNCETGFKEGSIIIVGAEMGEDKLGKEVAFCRSPCQINYTFKQKVAVCAGTQKYMGVHS